MNGLASRLDPTFRAALANLEIARLDEAPATVFGLHPDLTLGYMNRGWVRFAEANGGRETLARFGLGAPALAGITGPQRAFYERRFLDAIRSRSTWEHAYEAPSPTASRTYRLRVVPLPHDRLLAIHTLVLELPYPPEGVQAGDPEASLAYLDPSGQVVQCGHCRRVRHRETRVWDFVPQLVERPHPATSHGLCDVCLDYYYPRGPELTPASVG